MNAHTKSAGTQFLQNCLWIFKFNLLNFINFIRSIKRLLPS